MRIIAIGLIILGCGLSGPAAAQQQPPGPVTGQLQLVVTCPSTVNLAVTQSNLPAGWFPLDSPNSQMPFSGRNILGSNSSQMVCTYGKVGAGFWMISAVPPPGFPTCTVDPGANNKFICIPSDPKATVVTPTAAVP